MLSSVALIGVKPCKAIAAVKFVFDFTKDFNATADSFAPHRSSTPHSDHTFLYLFNRTQRSQRQKLEVVFFFPKLKAFSVKLDPN